MDAARRIDCVDRLQRDENWKHLMRIICCPTGRNLWFDLALRMQKENLAEFEGIFNTLKKGYAATRQRKQPKTKMDRK